MNLQQQLHAAGEAMNQFDWQRAGEIYGGILKQQPDNAGALMGVAMLLNRSGKYVEALQLLQRIWLAIQAGEKAEQVTVPAATRAEILAQMGLALQLSGQDEQAVKLYENAMALYPSTQLAQRITALKEKTKNAKPIDKLLTQAQQLAAQGRTEQAMAAWRDVLKLNPDHDIALHGLGDLHRLRREFKQALPLIQQAIIMQPRMPQYHNTLGMLFQQNGEYEKALIFHRRAIGIDDKYAAAHCNLGVALKNLNRLDDAVAEYQKALAIEPGMPEAHNNLGNLYRLLGQYDKAQASLQTALKHRPGYGDALRNLEALQALMKDMPVAAPKVGSKAGVKSAGKPTTGGKAKAGGKVKAGVKADGKAKVKAAGKAKVKAAGKAKVKAAAKTKTKAGAKGNAKAGAKAKATSAPKAKKAAGKKQAPTVKKPVGKKLAPTVKKPVGKKPAPTVKKPVAKKPVKKPASKVKEPAVKKPASKAKQAQSAKGNVRGGTQASKKKAVAKKRR